MLTKLAALTKNMMFIFIMLMGLSAFIFVSFFYEVEALKQQTKLTVERRAELISQHITYLTAGTKALQNALEKANLPSEIHPNEMALLEELQWSPEHQLFTLSDSSKNSTNHSFSGKLFALANQNIHNHALLNEMAATLSVDPIFNAFINKIETAQHIYYTSKKAFTYVAPVEPLTVFEFNQAHYNKPFWEQVKPENNPWLNPTISEINHPATHQVAGITLSNPVTINDEFIGAVSIDISIKDLNQLLAIDQNIKSSLLVNEHLTVTAAQDSNLLGTTLNLASLNTKGKCIKNQGGWLFSIPIVEDELFLIHGISNGEMLSQAAKNSLSLWALSFFGLLLTLVTLKLSRASEANKTLMLIDPLTKLYNRRGFEQLTNPTVAHINRVHQSWATLIIDLDCFKNINDHYGHATGDQVLISIANILKEYNRNESIVCRWGGEEFLIFVPYATQNSAAEVAERIRNKVEHTAHLKNNAPITCSIGFAIKKNEADIETTINNADKALYKAKQSGRNKAVPYTSTEKLEPDYLNTDQANELINFSK